MMKTHPTSLKTREERFEHYLELLGNEFDHVDRIKSFREYLTGLLLPGKRKSIEPLAARIDRESSVGSGDQMDRKLA